MGEKINRFGCFNPKNELLIHDALSYLRKMELLSIMALFFLFPEEIFSRKYELAAQHPRDYFY
jgi:hypothetical protein